MELIGIKFNSFSCLIAACHEYHNCFVLLFLATHYSQSVNLIQTGAMSTNVGGIALKFCTNICAGQMTNPTHFGDPLTPTQLQIGEL